MSRLRTIAFAAAWVVMLALSPVRAQERNAAWRGDYDTARKEAVNKGLPLFLVVYSDNCVHCRRLEAGPLRDHGVVELLNQRFVPIRVNGAKAPKLIEALRIQAYPTLVVAGTDGKVITFLEGYQEPRMLADQLQRALTVQAPADSKANNRERRAKELLAEARVANAAEKYSTALQVCEILGTTYKDLDEGKRAAELAAEIRSHPEKLAEACEDLSERLASMYFTLGETWLKKGEKDRAAAYFENAVRTAPASAIARDAQARLAVLQAKPRMTTGESRRP
jgi:thioredoxin-related protein